MRERGKRREGRGGEREETGGEKEERGGGRDMKGELVRGSKELGDERRRNTLYTCRCVKRVITHLFGKLCDNHTNSLFKFIFRVDLLLLDSLSHT